MLLTTCENSVFYSNFVLFSLALRDLAEADHVTLHYQLYRIRDVGGFRIEELSEVIVHVDCHGISR